MNNLENVFVNAQEAIDAAAQISTAIKEMQSGIDKLNAEMDLLHENTRTEWEARFHEDWHTFYTTKFPTVVKALEGQAANLLVAASTAQQLNM